MLRITYKKFFFTRLLNHEGEIIGPIDVQYRENIVFLAKQKTGGDFVQQYKLVILSWRY